MIKFGQWYYNTEKGHKFYIIEKASMREVYIGWIGHRGSAIRFDTDIIIHDDLDCEKTISVPFKDHSMIQDIFEKEWKNETI